MKALRSLQDQLQALSECGLEKLPLRQVRVLLLVAELEWQHGEADMRAIERQLGLPSAVVSRDLLGLGKRGRTGKGGLALIESREDRADLRRRPYRLTDKGRALISALRGWA